MGCNKAARSGQENSLVAVCHGEAFNLLEFLLYHRNLVEPTPFCPRCVSCLILTQREFGRKAACRIYASTKTDAQRHSSSSTNLERFPTPRAHVTSCRLCSGQAPAQLSAQACSPCLRRRAAVKTHLTRNRQLLTSGPKGVPKPGVPNL
jgi:DNA-directed RNA polymerase subunit M/transcription elongation factor TFIIS